ncbi:TadE family type IV pilus minor pilin [Streptomyces bluensis]|uniref:TadE family type IV pilus minor pilin n=1 Tax=Streptomyces bluensis TaxID=33897 RepID=UPI003331B873
MAVRERWAVRWGGGRRGAWRRAVERRRDRGFVTAEAAVALPVLVLFAMALVWALLAACAQIQCVDAARAGARAAARQDPPDSVLAMARRLAPDGARVTVSREGDLVHVVVAANPPGPDALGLDLSHEAVALAEETVGARG